MRNNNLESSQIIDNSGNQEYNILDSILLEMINIHINQQLEQLNEVVKITLTREQYNEFIKTNIMTKNLLDLHSIKDEKCSICQENVNIGDNCAITPCNHLYHSTCSIEWFIKKCIRPTCPICRMDVRAAS